MHKSTQTYERTHNHTSSDECQKIEGRGGGGKSKGHSGENGS